MNRKTFAMWTMMLLMLVLAACNNQMDEGTTKDNAALSDSDVETATASSEQAETLRATLINREGAEVGTVDLQEGVEGVKITVEAQGLPPGLHGFHIHEKGACDPPEFKSAGEHFNPTEADHGFDHPKGPHAGDLLNLNVAADGTASAEFLNDMVTLREGAANSLLKEGGTSFVIHAKPDDYVSQPSGDAGDRIACGVIKQ
ncbi:superoxide dismutase family protein [Ornithinibacillus gellani]|uniref:superoxide dismutase family protein n=1 Tax=Ornithinibacillus gellani TaxID=2293253 RepID=UPI000F481BEF|nr:superoxide dismutase family protein [Ornithinibacillus gellani]TQS72035.1 superoxide dismutase family protein [Ornithinibacillus gellani]